MANLRPLGDKILIKQDEVEERTESGLLFKPQNAQERPLSGVVVATGRGLLDRNGTLHEPRVKRGDKVMFARYSGTDIEVDGEEFVIIREGDIFGVLEND